MTDRSLPILAVQAPAPSGAEDPLPRGEGERIHNTVIAISRHGSSGLNRRWSQMREGDPVLELPLYDGALDPRRFGLGGGGERLGAGAGPPGAGAEPEGAGAERHPAR